MHRFDGCNIEDFGIRCGNVWIVLRAQIAGAVWVPLGALHAKNLLCVRQCTRALQVRSAGWCEGVCAAVHTHAHCRQDLPGRHLSLCATHFTHSLGLSRSVSAPPLGVQYASLVCWQTLGCAVSLVHGLADDVL